VRLVGVIMPPISVYTVGHSQLRVQKYLFIYNLLSRKLLNSEVCDNASGYGLSVFTVPNASGFLICTHTEGPSPVVLRCYILIISLYASGRSW